MSVEVRFCPCHQEDLLACLFFCWCCTHLFWLLRCRDLTSYLILSCTREKRHGAAPEEAEGGASNARAASADHPDSISDSTSEGGAPGTKEQRPQPQKLQARSGSYLVDQLADIAAQHLPSPAAGANGAGGGAGAGFIYDAAGGSAGGEGPPLESGEDDGEELEPLQDANGGKYRMGGDGGAEHEGMGKGGREDVDGDTDETSDENGC